MMPHGVVIPKTYDDIIACLAFARDTERRYCRAVVAPRNVGKRSIMPLF